MNRGEQLADIMRRLDAATESWVAAGYPYDGPIYAAREAVYTDLHAWNNAT